MLSLSFGEESRFMEGILKMKYESYELKHGALSDRVLGRGTGRIKGGNRSWAKKNQKKTPFGANVY